MALIIGGSAGLIAAAIVIVLSVMDGREGEPVQPQNQSQQPGADGAPAAPDAENARLTLDYLEGKGAEALTMHRAAVDLGSQPTTEQCRRVAADLDQNAPPGNLVLVIGRVPDTFLRDALLEERASLGLTLTACAAGQSPIDDRVAPLSEIVPLVQQRIEALEAAR